MATIDYSNTPDKNISIEKIEALISIGAGKIVANAVNKIIHYQLSKYKNYIAQINCDLEKFEKRYGMPTKQFYSQFETGELGDKEDFFEWSSLYENVLLFEKRIQELENLDKK